MLADIATEELSHLEMVGQALVLLMKGTPADEVDQVEGDYLGELLEGKHEALHRTIGDRTGQRAFRWRTTAHRLGGQCIHRRLDRHHRRADSGLALGHRR